MNSNQESSLYTSSVRSYKNIGLSPMNDNFIKYLNNKHTFDKSSEEEYDSHNPAILRRNQSFNAFTSKILDRPSLERRESSKPTFQKVDIYSSLHKPNSEIAVLQAQITRYASNELILQTQKQLLVKQNQRLKEQIDYLRQKQSQFNQKSEELMKSQSKVEILERQYHNLLTEYERFKINFNGPILENVRNSREIIFNSPLKIGDKYRERGSYQLPEYQHRITTIQEENANDIPHTLTIIGQRDRANQKINWKRVSGAGTSPINKIVDSDNKINQAALAIQDFDNKNPISRKIHRYTISGNTNNDEMMLSKEKINEGQQEHHSSSSIYNSSDSPKNSKRAVDQKYMNKLKEFQKRAQNAEIQVKNLRLKNIELYGKSEEIEAAKIKYLQQINQLRYQKSKQLADQKQKQGEYQTKLEEIKRELENVSLDKNKIQLANHNCQKVLVALKEEKSLAQEKVKRLEKDTQEYEQQRKNANIVLGKYQQLVQQLSSQKKQSNQIRIKYQQQKLLLEQIQSTKKDEYLSKLQQLNEINLKLKTERDGLTAELIKLKQECCIMQVQLTKWRQQNRLQVDNTIRLTNMIQHYKQENIRLYELGNSWKQIQRRTKMMKHMNSTINHLWEIKEVEYSNINDVIQQLNKLIQ